MPIHETTIKVSVFYTLEPGKHGGAVIDDVLTWSGDPVRLSRRQQNRILAEILRDIHEDREMKAAEARQES